MGREFTGSGFSKKERQSHRKKGIRMLDDVDVCNVMVEEKSHDGLYRWFHTDEQMVKNTEKINLSNTEAIEAIEDEEERAVLKGLSDRLFEIKGVSRGAVSKYLLTVNLASELFDWEKDKIEQSILFLIQRATGRLARITKRKDIQGTVEEFSPDKDSEDVPVDPRRPQTFPLPK